MRILFCNKYNFPFSGTEVYLSELTSLLRSEGHQTASFGMSDMRGATSEYSRFLVPHLDFKDPQHGPVSRARLAAHAIYSLSARKRLRSLIREFKPDVAHVRNIYHHLSPSILWELNAHGIPVIYHLNDFKLLCPSYNCVADGSACELCNRGKFWHVLTAGCYPGAGARGILAMEAYVHQWLRTYQHCVSRFLAPSYFVREKLAANGWDEKRIQVLYHFQKLPRWDTQPVSNNAAVLYFGRLSREKGLRDLLLAMQRLPEINLLVVGDGPQRTELQTTAASLSLRNVQFAGHLEGAELYERIGASCFTLMPSHAYETFGKTILESYAHGRAVIASDLGPRRELIVHGRTGLLFEAGKVEQLAAAISLLHSNPEAATKMGSAGRELVRLRHTPEHHYNTLVQLYEELSHKNQPQFAVPGPAKPRLRIAFVGGRGVVSKYSGIEACYEEVGKRLVAMGHEVTIYCRTYFTPNTDEYEGMRLVRLPTIRSKHLETAVHTLLSSVHSMFSRNQIVHYHALGPALFSFLPRLTGKKTAVTVQGLDWQRKKWGPIARAVLQLGEKAAISFPNLTVVVSKTLHAYYASRYRAVPSFIPNGTDVYPRITAKQILKWELQPGKYILFLGRFSPEKNCELLIDAYEKLDTPVKLVLAGGSSHCDDYAWNLRKRENERIRILDWVFGESLLELLTNAMLFVLPSDLEGLSLALLDAMGAGICVLTSDIAENRELVDDGAGFTFRRGDRDDLARMLRLLICDPQVRMAAGQRAQERVRTGYLWRKITQEHERAYLRLIGQNEDAGAQAVPSYEVCKRMPQEEEQIA
ncbi:MAG TPA: glycosyltransferase [Terriglobales bacterium]|nr:glycosyltransferase [Terriglobales bacterium]